MCCPLPCFLNLQQPDELTSEVPKLEHRSALCGSRNPDKSETAEVGEDRRCLRSFEPTTIQANVQKTSVFPFVLEDGEDGASTRGRSVPSSSRLPTQPLRRLLQHERRVGLTLSVHLTILRRAASRSGSCMQKERPPQSSPSQRSSSTSPPASTHPVAKGAATAEEACSIVGRGPQHAQSGVHQGRIEILSRCL